MDREEELAVVRRAYAKQTLAQVQIEDARLELAFATVRREDFLGPGPWVIPRWLGGRSHPERRSGLSLRRWRR
jgi:protein-L-isoaspartate(D-aspartate) O-methyltransferase